MKKFRKAVFVVVYKFENKEPEYLILKRKLHWKGWEFPKGGVEKGESLIQAVKRETREETGLRILKIKKFKVSGKYKYLRILKDRPNYIGQKYSLFAIEVVGSKVSFDKKEHSAFMWLSFSKAKEKLSWPNQKKCLAIVHRFLS